MILALIVVALCTVWFYNKPTLTMVEKLVDLSGETDQLIEGMMDRVQDRLKRRAELIKAKKKSQELLASDNPFRNAPPRCDKCHQYINNEKT